MGRNISYYLVGQKFGKLTVLAFSRKHHTATSSRVFWSCQCDCGNVTEANTSQLRAGKRKTCGCDKEERSRESVTKGKKNTAWGCWRSMKDRCTREKMAAYEKYGGAGVVVHQEWLESFESFLEHIGPRPSRNHSIDRIDPFGGYVPGNVRWATPQEQAQNKRKIHKVCYMGVDRTIAEWSEILGVSKSTLSNRRWRGFTSEEVLFGKTPSQSPTQTVPAGM